VYSGLKLFVQYDYIDNQSDVAFFNYGQLVFRGGVVLPRFRGQVRKARRRA